MRSDPQSKALTVKQRLRMGDRIFNISGPPLDVDEGDEMVRFPAVEVAQDG
jgi:hypothetical protein